MTQEQIDFIRDRDARARARFLRDEPPSGEYAGAVDTSALVGADGMLTREGKVFEFLLGLSAFALAEQAFGAALAGGGTPDAVTDAGHTAAISRCVAGLVCLGPMLGALYPGCGDALSSAAEASARECLSAAEASLAGGAGRLLRALRGEGPSYHVGTVVVPVDDLMGEGVDRAALAEEIARHVADFIGNGGLE